MTPQPHPQVTYSSAHSRARVVVILLITGAILSALTIPAYFAEAMSSEFAEGQEIADNPWGFLATLLKFGLGLLSLIVYVATIITFLMWLYRAANNLRAFGFWASQFSHSAGWAVGSFFVPIVSLFVPYQAVKEVWEKSRPAESESFSFSNSAPGFFPAWWGFWLTSNFASNIYWRISSSELPRGTVAIVGIISEVLSIAAAVFAINVVRDIDRRQEETMRHLVLGQQAPVPPPPPLFHPQVPGAG